MPDSVSSEIFFDVQRELLVVVCDRNDSGAAGVSRCEIKSLSITFDQVDRFLTVQPLWLVSEPVFGVLGATEVCPVGLASESPQLTGDK